MLSVCIGFLLSERLLTILNSRKTRWKFLRCSSVYFRLRFFIFVLVLVFEREIFFSSPTLCQWRQFWHIEPSFSLISIRTRSREFIRFSRSNIFKTRSIKPETWLVCLSSVKLARRLLLKSVSESFWLREALIVLHLVRTSFSVNTAKISMSAPARSSTSRSALLVSPPAGSAPLLLEGWRSVLRPKSLYNGELLCTNMFSVWMSWWWMPSACIIASPEMRHPIILFRTSSVGRGSCLRNSLRVPPSATGSVTMKFFPKSPRRFSSLYGFGLLCFSFGSTATEWFRTGSFPLKTLQRVYRIFSPIARSCWMSLSVLSPLILCLSAKVRSPCLISQTSP